MLLNIVDKAVFLDHAHIPYKEELTTVERSEIVGMVKAEGQY